MAYTYDYPRPMLTVDIVIVAGKLSPEILFIKRRNNPFAGCWALPGGFVEMDENLEQAALRELAEETGLVLPALQQFRAYGEPGRDPRGRNVAVVHFALLPQPIKVSSGDDAEAARWFPLSALPELAFDHAQIIRDFVASH